MIYPLFNLQLIFNVVPFAPVKPSFDFSQYFFGTMPLLMQLTLAPLSISATVFVEKSSTIRVTMENHFWKVIFDIVCINCFVGISVSEILVISIGIVGEISICCGGVCNNANLALSVRSFVLRLMTSFFKYLTYVFNWLISYCKSFVVIRWNGFGIGNCLYIFVKAEVDALSENLGVLSSSSKINCFNFFQIFFL